MGLPEAETVLIFPVTSQIDMAGEHLLCPAYSFGTSCRLLHEPLLYRHTGLLQTGTEGVPVTLSGRHVADHSTSEELSSVGGGAIAKSITLTYLHFLTNAFYPPTYEDLKSMTHDPGISNENMRHHGTDIQ